MRWMEIAWEQEGAGVAEIGGPRSHDRIVAYFHAAGRPEVTSDEVPWCAAAYLWCLGKAGIDYSHIPKSERLLAVSARRIGTRIRGPRVGAACVMKRPGGHHVALVVSWTATSIRLLGGNQRDSFSAIDFRRTDDMEFYWPQGVSPRDLDKSGSRITKAAARQKRDATAVVGSNTVPVPDVPPAPSLPPVPEPAALPEPGALAGKLGQVQGATEQLISFAAFVQGKWPWVVLAVTVYFGARMAWDAWQIRNYRAEDASTGKTT